MITPPSSPPGPQPRPSAAADGTDEVAALVARIVAVDPAAAAPARAHDQQLTKPAGSLGRIEQIGFQLAALAGTELPPPVEPATVVVFAADHGVHEEGVSPWPQAVTGQMVANFCQGGAAINVIARANGLDVTVVNIGVAAPLPDHDRLLNRPIRAGSANLRRGPALSVDEAARAVALGAEIAAQLVAAGSRCLLTGDMGIANTTPSAAVVAAITGADPAAITGRGTGIDEATLVAKIAVVSDAVARLDPDMRADPLRVLAEVGGLEIAGLAGLCLGGAAARIPVVVDGVIALAGALVACTLAPATVDYLIGGHRSVEPAATVVLERLGLDPLLELDLRLGEGTGAALAYPLVRAAARLPREMATFGGAGVDQG